MRPPHFQQEDPEPRVPEDFLLSLAPADRTGFSLPFHRGQQSLGKDIRKKSTDLRPGSAKCRATRPRSHFLASFFRLLTFSISGKGRTPSKPLAPA